MRISDWSSDVCSSDLLQGRALALENLHILIELGQAQFAKLLICREVIIIRPFAPCLQRNAMPSPDFAVLDRRMREKEKRRLLTFHFGKKQGRAGIRSEEHTSELQSLMRIASAVFCLKKKTIKSNTRVSHIQPHIINILNGNYTKRQPRN